MGHESLGGNGVKGRMGGYYIGTSRPGREMMHDRPGLDMQVAQHFIRSLSVSTWAHNRAVAPAARIDRAEMSLGRKP
jgi:hypothetical protein